MKTWAVCLLLVVFPFRAFADEGMWTFNAFPSEKVKAKYGFAPSKDWLQKVQLSSARLARGCSGSFVSSQGLVMTNHHCVSSCVEQLSTAQKNLMEVGFLAKTPADEIRCPEIEINQLVEMTDVTSKLASATKGLSGKEFNVAQKAAMSKLEKECATSDDIRCDVVTLYRGGQYQLYRYRRFQDVRLVFAPELAIAFFGGDPDNFNFPRYDLDAAFLRIYESGKPAQVQHFLPWSAQGPAEGDLTFVSGHPGGTNRLLTVSQLAYERDVRLPATLLSLAEIRGYLTQFQARGAEQKRISGVTLFRMENSFKALKGRHSALLNAEFFASKVAQENALRARVNANPKLKKAYGGAWDAIASSIETYKPFRARHDYVENGRGFQSQLFGIAKTLVRAAAELPKPNEQRLREFSESALPALKQKLFSSAPIYEELEINLLTHSLTKLREELGPDEPLVRQVLGNQSPAEVAEKLVKGTLLKDVATRRNLFEKGQWGIDSAKDTMISLALALDGEARAIRKKYEDEVEGPLKQNAEKVARALFEVQGTGNYPDATFTLRLSYGQVQGWNDVAPMTTIDGAFKRHTGRDPFALPASWLSAKNSLNLATPFNFVTTNDIIGGNSGSPVVNQNGEVVGLIFDGNIHSLGGDYGFDARLNRAVAVHSEAILEALSKVYQAHRIVEELRPSKAAKVSGDK